MLGNIGLYSRRTCGERTYCKILAADTTLKCDNRDLTLHAMLSDEVAMVR